MITVDDISNVRPRFYRELNNQGYRGNKYRYEVFQENFLAEIDPSGHKINDPSIYENIRKQIPRKDGFGNEIKDENGNLIMNIAEIPIERVSIPLQQVIKTKHVSNITAESTKFTHLKLNASEKEQGIFISQKNGWVTKNMETAKYEFIDSVKTVGDAAFCAIMYKGKFSYKVFSKLNGDKLHPIFDSMDNLKVFGREYTVYDYANREETYQFDIWDDRYLSTYKYTTDSTDTVSFAWDEDDDYKMKSTDTNKIEGWKLIKRDPHGFSYNPIVYIKNPKGACWSHVQNLIEKLEVALSQLAENNKSYAFRIMVIKGGCSIQGDLRGEARAILLDDEKSDAKFLDKADASDTFELQLKTLLQHILLGSFVVVPPEVNGDVSGVAVKILYSPAFEQGVEDINFFNKSLDNMFKLFQEGYGIEMGDITGYKSLQVRADMKPYIPQNENEKQQNLTLGVQNGYLSKESAADQNTEYSSPDENARLVKQDEYESELEAGNQRAQLVGDETV